MNKIDITTIKKNPKDDFYKGEIVLSDNDGMAFKYTANIPYLGKPWYYKIWKRIKYMFVKPKFTASNLKKIERNLPDFVNYHFPNATKKGERIIMENQYPLFMSESVYKKYKDFIKDL